MHFRRPRAWLAMLALTMVTAGAGGLAGPVTAAPFHFNALPWLGAAMDVADMFGAPGRDPGGRRPDRDRRR